MSAGTFIKVCHDMPDHPKIDGLSDRAFRDLVRLWCWCGRYLTDGAITARKFEGITTTDSARELIDAGLVEPDGAGGWAMHDYLEHQTAKATVDATREHRRAAGRRGAHARWSSNGMASAIANQEANTRQDDARCTDVQISDVQMSDVRSQGATSVAPSTRRKPAKELPADWKPKQTHADYASKQDLDLPTEVMKFRAHAEANDRRQVSWDAAFTQWLVGALRFRKPALAAASKPRDPRVPEGW